MDFNLNYRQNINYDNIQFDDENTIFDHSSKNLQKIKLELDHSQFY